MGSVIWTVTIKKSWFENLCFEFDDSGEAEAFAENIRDHYVLDDCSFTVTVTATFADVPDIKKRNGEGEEESE